MTLESSETRAFTTGHVYYAPLGTAYPADITTSFSHAAGWFEAGHLSDAGPQFSFGKARNPVTSWQSFPRPVRNLKGAAVESVKFDLLQWNRNSIQLAFGGGTWSTDTTGAYRFTPPDDEDVDYRALGIELVDGDYTYRFLAQKVENQAPTAFSAVATGLSPLPIEAVILEPDSGAPWVIQTNDPNATSAEAAS